MSLYPYQVLQQGFKTWTYHDPDTTASPGVYTVSLDYRGTVFTAALLESLKDKIQSDQTVISNVLKEAILAKFRAITGVTGWNPPIPVFTQDNSGNRDSINEDVILTRKFVPWNIPTQTSREAEVLCELAREFYNKIKAEPGDLANVPDYMFISEMVVNIFDLNLNARIRRNNIEARKISPTADAMTSLTLARDDAVTYALSVINDPIRSPEEKQNAINLVLAAQENYNEAVKGLENAINPLNPGLNTQQNVYQNPGYLDLIGGNIKNGGFY